MASGITTVAQVAPPIPVSFLNRMLSIPTPYNIHNVCANQFTMPAQGGNILRMRRPNRLPTAKAPLGITGINPPPVIPTVTDIDAELNLYGQFMLVNEQVRAFFVRKVACYKSVLIDLEAYGAIALG